MRILGLDIGSKTIGIAVSDPFGWTAQGVMTWQRRDMARDLQAVQKVIAEYEIEQIVAGLPLNMNGSQGPSVVMSKEFAEALQKETGLPLDYYDERLSTVAAQRVLLEGDVSRKKRKGLIDKMAAVIILQGYLEKKEKK